MFAALARGAGIEIYGGENGAEERKEMEEETDR